MSSIEPRNIIDLGKGCLLKMYEDTSEAPDSGRRFYTEAEYDGGEGSSEAPVVAMHWHKHHDEWIEVVSGRLSAYLHGKWTTRTPESGPLFVPRRVTHGFKFFKGEKTVVRERTSPSGAFKQIFFEDAFGDGNPPFFKAMRAFSDGDGYVALPFGIGFIDEAFVAIGGFIGRFFYPRPQEIGSSMPPLK